MNKHRPHLLVLPEDDANRELANGFLLYHNTSARSIQVLPCAGGWLKVLDQFTTVHVPHLERHQLRSMLLLIDFDEMPNRRAEVSQSIPLHLLDRVFVLGVWSEPENLRKVGLGPLERVGTKLARECDIDALTLWNHELLRHNHFELARMALHLKHILFV